MARPTPPEDEPPDDLDVTEYLRDHQAWEGPA